DNGRPADVCSSPADDSRAHRKLIKVGQPAPRQAGNRASKRRFYRARILRRRSTYAVETAAPAITTSRTQSQTPGFEPTDWVEGPDGVPGFVPGWFPLSDPLPGFSSPVPWSSESLSSVSLSCSSCEPE